MRDKLGKPRKVTTGHNDFGNYTQYRYKHKIIGAVPERLDGHLDQDLGRRERTKEGIGVGSSESRRSRTPSRTSSAARSSRAAPATSASCRPGKRVTDFQLRERHRALGSDRLVID